jgi:hypothetical protein
MSFCNIPVGAPLLALLERESGVVRRVRVPRELFVEGGATGVAVTDRFVYVAAQSTQVIDHADPRVRSGILTFDRSDFRLIQFYECSSVFDVHSLCVLADELVVVSTGTDELVSLGLRGANIVSETVVWRADLDGPRTDNHHLNAIYPWRGDLVVSGFGKKTGTLWSSATQGFLQCVGSGERLASFLHHPHSITDIGDTLAYCESATRSVRLIGKSGRGQLPGYTRGLCRAGDDLFVATSRSRFISKSRRIASNSVEPGAATGDCTVVRLCLNDLRIKQIIDLTTFGCEVYDLQPISTIENWPIENHNTVGAMTVLGT